MARLSSQDALFLALVVAVAALALWQFGWLGTSWDTPIPHGVGEDWDWQLTPLEAARQAWSEGQLPLWNPYTGGGVPLLGNPETPVLYPGFAFVALFGAEAGLKLMLALHAALLALGFGLAGRELKLSPLAAQLPALFLLCSAFLPGFIGWGHVMFAPIGYLPLAWVALRRRRGALAGLMLGLCGLAGGHYLLLYGLLWLGADSLLRCLEEGGLRWLAAPLLLNGLLLGQGWAAWPLLLLFLVALGMQRWGRWKHALGPLGVALLVLALVLAPRLVAMWPALELSARMGAQQLHEVADPYSLVRAFEVVSGQVERPSGHEGQQVFWSPWPVLLGGLGVLLALRRRPVLALLALLFWNLGWAGATPLSLMDALGRLPGYRSIRVVERFSLVWTPLLGMCAGFLFDRARGLHRALGLPVLVLLAAWISDAAPRAAQLQRFGPGTPREFLDNALHQARSNEHLTNYQSALWRQGRLDQKDALDLPRSEALRGFDEEDYRGEVWLLDGGQPIQAELSTQGARFSLERPGTVVLNANQVSGWPGQGHQGLVAVELPAGEHALRYWPRGLGLALAAAALGLLLGLAGAARAPPPPPA